MKQDTLLACILAAPLLALGCNTLLQDRVSPGLCGDGVKQAHAGEECDDGNLVSGDGCSAACLSEDCGNGRVDPGEECDHREANDNAGDCTRVCKLARCGDGFVKSHGTLPYERCDDGNEDDGDGCSVDCALRGSLQIQAGRAGGRGIANGVGPSARFAGIRSVAVDGDFAFLAENDSCAVKSLHLPSGRVETVAGDPGNCEVLLSQGVNVRLFRGSKHLAIAGDHLYMTESNALRRIDLSAEPHAVATCLYDALPESMTGIASLPQNPGALLLLIPSGVFRLDLPCDCSPGQDCPVYRIAGGGAGGMVDGVGLDAAFALARAPALDPSGTVLYLGDLSSVRSVNLVTTEVTTHVGLSSDRLVLGLAARETSLYAVDTSLSVDPDASATVEGWSVVRSFDTTTWTSTHTAGAQGSLSGADESTVPECDGFGSFARMAGASALGLWGDTLLVGEDASVRAVSIPTGEVVTAAGALVQDFTWYGVAAVAAGSGKLYAPAHTGELLEIDLVASKPWRRVGLCQPDAGSAHLVTGLSVYGSSLFVSDVGAGGICHVSLEGGRGSPCCASCEETCEMVWTAPDTFSWAGMRPRGLAWDGTNFYVARTDVRAVLELRPGDPDPHEVFVGDVRATPESFAVARGALFIAWSEINQIERIDLTTHATRFWGPGNGGATVDGRADPTAPGPEPAATFCHPTALATDGRRVFVGESHCEPANGQF